MRREGVKGDRVPTAPRNVASYARIRVHVLLVSDARCEQGK